MFTTYLSNKMIGPRAQSPTQDGSHVLTIEESPINKAPSDMDMTDQVQEINQLQQGSPAIDSSFEKDPDGDEACLVVKIPKIERDCMARPLDNTLIIKLLGISIGFNFLEKRIKELLLEIIEQTQRKR